MRAPNTQRPPLPAVAGVALGLAVLAGVVVLGTVQWAYLIPLLLILAVGAVAYLAWHVDPAWFISIGVASSIFSEMWNQIGGPASILPPHRLLLLLGILGLLFRVPAMGERPPLRIKRVHWIMVLTILYAICSAALAGTLVTTEGLFGIVDRLGVVPFILFFLAPVAFRTEKQRAILLGVLVATGGYLGVTAFFEFIGPQALVFPKYILDPSVGVHVGRARGPFVEAVANGLALFMCGTAAMVAAAVWKRTWTRVLALGVVLVCGIGLVMTLTRAVWLASFVAAMVTFLATKELRRFALPAGIAALVGVVGALAFVPGLSEEAADRQSDKLPLWDRANMNSAAFRMVAERPLVGFGWNSYAVESREYFRQGEEYPLRGFDLDLHNVYLSHTVELGIIGALIWLTALLMAIGGAIIRRGPPKLRPWRVALIAIAIEWAIVANFGPLAYPMPNMLLWLWAGVVVARPDELARLSRAALAQRMPSVPAVPVEVARPLRVVPGEADAFWFDTYTLRIGDRELLVADPDDLLEPEPVRFSLDIVDGAAPLVGSGDVVPVSAEGAYKRIVISGLAGGDNARFAAFLRAARRQAREPARV